MKLHTISIVFLALFVCPNNARSLWQKQQSIPHISVSWKDTPEKTYSLQHARLEKWAIFDRIDEPHIQEHMLPETIECLTPSSFQNNSIQKKTLTNICENFLSELHQTKKRKHSFSSGFILKDADFNYQQHTGTIIVKLHHYPFVLKLFCETPNSFVKPFSKGIVPSFLFGMGGGINRFLAGFTRIPNLQAIQTQLAQFPEWKNKITLPRKWYWIPQKTKYITIQGENFAKDPHIHYELTLPATYGIIADYIQVERQFSIQNSADRTYAIQLQKFFKNRIDPYLCNFFYTPQHTVALIDTEHFATIMGLDKHDQFTDYTDLVVGISTRYLKRNFFSTKKERLRRCWQDTPDALKI